MTNSPVGFPAVRQDHRLGVALVSIVASVLLGAGIVLAPTLVLGAVAVGVFVLLWSGPRWGVLVVPVAWMLAGDPVLIQMTGASASRPFYLAMDAWTLLAFFALFVGALRGDTAARQAVRSPIGLGVLALWASFLVSSVLGTGSGASLGTQWADGRGILYAGWLLVASVIFVSTRSRAANIVVGLLAGGVAVKGLVFYLTGIGVKGASYVAGYRAFGSEETTVGLILLAVGLALVGNKKVRRSFAYGMFAVGVVIVLLGSLRAYWLASLGVVVALIVLQAVRSPARSVRTVAWLLSALALMVLTLATVARRFYEVAIAKRFVTLAGGARAAQGDISLGYRFIEFATVRQAVGPRVLFGSGLGAIHRGVLIYNPADLFQQNVLSGYVHNSFLWSYLKAGLLGVAGCVAYYAGTIVEPIRVLRSKPRSVLRDISLAFAAVAVGLVFVGLFNALVTSARYQIVVALAFGWYYGLAHRPEETTS